jgi:transposase-like protein
MARRYASLIEFQRRFPDEASCALFLSERRWPEGFTCRACGGTRSCPLKSRAYTHECLTCGRQTSVTAGTIMHRTKLPLTTWFWAAHLMATHSNGMSAQQLMGQLGLGSYKTAWLLAQKLRRSMVDPNRDPLEGVVEVDQSEMPLRTDDDPGTPLKTGKIIIIGAVEVIDRATGKAQRPKALGQKYLDTLSGRIRLAAIPSNHATHIHAFIKANIAPGATLITDGHASYCGLPEYRHDPRVVGTMAAHIPLRWIHRVFALLKRWSLGTYHGLRRQHLDVYLNEFVFRYNRRFYRHASFETVLRLAAHGSPLSYWDITGQQNPRKNAAPTRRNPRRRKTASGMRQDSVEPAEVDESRSPGTTV